MRQVSPKLQPWLAVFNEQLAILIENGFKATPVNAREGLANLTRGLVTTSPVIAWVQDDIVAGEEYDVPVRIYHPDPTRELPVLVYFHGGGHMGGSVTVYDPLCRKMALTTQHIVVSVEYRLAPECPYPAGLNDAYNVVKHLWTTLESQAVRYAKQLSIGGDSGGGALAASVSRLAQFDASVSIHRQVLIYPSLDYTMSMPSLEQNAIGYLLHTSKIAWYFDNYFRHGENRYQASPLYGEFTPNLPETFVITAEFCPLRDEGFAYVNQLEDNDIPVSHLHFEDMIHTFMNMEDLVQAECEQVYREMGHFLNS